MSADSPEAKHFIVAVTGASGSAYGLKLVSELLGSGARVSLILSAAGRQVLNHELDLDWSTEITSQQRQVQEYFSSTLVGCLANDDFWVGSASGSAAADAMVVVPCSMGSVGRIAAGLSGNLLERVADVMLKERRPLIMVPRETPFNTIHLENLLRLSQAGAVILPAMPGFYHKPEKVDDLIAFVVGKVLDQLGLSHALFKRWGEEQG